MKTRKEKSFQQEVNEESTITMLGCGFEMCRDSTSIKIQSGHKADFLPIYFSPLWLCGQVLK